MAWRGGPAHSGVGFTSAIRTTPPTAPDLAEKAITRLKAVVTALDLPWDYAPLHRHLRAAVDEGDFNDPERG